MGKILKLACLVSCAAILSACGQASGDKASMEITSQAGSGINESVTGTDINIAASSAGEPSETESSPAAEEDSMAQLQLIADNEELWLDPADGAVNPYSYAVTDLNQNGRLEIIAASCQGTGIYTYSNIFEVNEAMDGLVSYERVLEEYVSEADIIVGAVPVYYDSEKDVYHYIFNDFSKNGAAEYYENKRDWYLNEGKIIENFLAYRSVIYAGTNPSVQKITCFDAGEGSDQKEITEEEFNNIENTVFADLEKKTANIHWITRETATAEMNISEVMSMLSESWEAFHIE